MRCMIYNFRPISFYMTQLMKLSFKNHYFMESKYSRKTIAYFSFYTTGVKNIVIACRSSLEPYPKLSAYDLMQSVGEFKIAESSITIFCYVVY